MTDEKLIYLSNTNKISLTMEIEITKMTSKGQVVIPQEIREKEKLIEGERFFVYSKDDSIILKRAKNLEAAEDYDEFERVFNKAWKIAKENGVTRKDIKEAIAASRARK